MTLSLRFIRFAFLALLIGSTLRVEGTMLTPEGEKFYQKEFELEKESNNFNHSNDEATVAKLSSLVVEGIQWGNVDVQSALNDLAVKSKQVDPAHIGFNFELQLPVDPRRVDKLGRTVRRNVCVVLSEKISLFELIDAISGQTNLSFKVEKGRVIFMQWVPGNYIHLNLDLG